MKKTTVNLKRNKPATVFNALKITQTGVDFISFDTMPDPVNPETGVSSQQQRHETRIELRLECCNIISTETMCLDDSSNNEQVILWQGYKIRFNGLSGYTDTEVKFEIEKTPEEDIKSMKREEGNVVTVFNKRTVTAVLAYDKPVMVFDAFSIALSGIKNSSIKSKPGSSCSSSKETVLFNLKGFGQSFDASIVIASSAHDFQIQPITWQGYKFSYNGPDAKEKLLFLIEEIPGEPAVETEKKPAWKSFLGL